MKIVNLFKWYIFVYPSLLDLYKNDEDTLKTIINNKRKLKVIYVNKTLCKLINFIEYKLIYSYV